MTPKEGSNQGKEDPNQGLLRALNHPFRRALLRRFVDGKEVSPVDLAELTHQPLSNVSYHVRVLIKFGALELISQQPSRGSVKHFYQPTALVTETPWVVSALDNTVLEEPQEKRRVRRRKKPGSK